MRENIFRPEDSREKMKFEEAFAQLQNILEALKELGLTIPEYCYSEEKIKEEYESGHTFPSAREGLDGIRAKRWRDGNFRISFTNGFEDPDNPERIEITEQLRARGFNVA